MDRKRQTPDYWLLVIVSALLTLGLLMVFSASSVTAADTYNDPYHFVKRQGTWAVLSFIGMLVAMRIDLALFRKWTLPLIMVSVAALAAVLVPHVGVVVNGARRWINLGPLGFQPSELAKFALVFYLADCLARRGDKILKFTRLLPILVIFLVVVGLVELEPDLGTVLVIGASCMMVLFMSGAGLKHLMSLVGGGVGIVAILVCLQPYRLERLRVWWDPFIDPRNTGYQICQSLIALGSGGMTGLGLGESRQKCFYLPEQHTDFIFAVLGEELGLAATIGVLILFFCLLHRGIRIALRSKDNYLALLALGITFTITFQAFLNIGVVSGAVPLTGIPLPFISYGGTSLAITMVAIGLLMNVSSHRVKERYEESGEIVPPPSETESLARRFKDLGLGLAPTDGLQRKTRRRRSLATPIALWSGVE